ncbi:MAG: hypothetical protein ACFFCM_02850 [Promethearchaeota archaeon]
MVNYPIAGYYRGILLPLEIIMTGIILEISVFFFLMYLRNKRESRPSGVEFDWGILFISFGIAYINYITGDFLFVSRDFFLILGYTSLVIGGFLFAYHIESSKIINTKYFFTGFTIIVLFLYFSILIIAPSMIQTVASITAFPAYLLLLIYFVKIFKKIWVRYKLHSMGLFIGFFLWFLGYTATADMAVELFNTLDIRILGDCIIIMGMIILSLSLNAIPSLNEIGWFDQIKYILLIYKSGICLYNENFKEKRAINETVLAGALAAVKLIMEENLTRKEKLKVLSKAGEVFLIEEGEYIIGALIAEQELEISKYFLKKIIQQFEDFFREFLQKWDGNINIFKPTKGIISKILSIEKI